MKANRRGLTLTELLMAMAIFALGGASIVALFLANAKLSAQAVNMTRAAEITRNVRAFITASLTRPIPQPVGPPLYRFDYAGASLKFRPALILARESSGRFTPLTTQEIEDMAGKPAESAVYFYLPTELFNATLDDKGRADLMVDLPDEALTREGKPKYPNNKPEVYRLLPDAMRESAVIRGFDADDRMFYSFDFSIRRAVSRGSGDYDESATLRAPLEDLYVVHLRVYRGFDLAEENDNISRDNERNIIYETSFFVTAAR